VRLRTLNTLDQDGSEQAVRVVACWSWRDARGRSLGLHFEKSRHYRIRLLAKRSWRNG
jgi:hypothetical protein